MSITRRVFLRNGALAVVGTAAIPSFLTRAAFRRVESRRRQQAPGRHLPAGRGRRTEHRGAARRARVLRHAAVSINIPRNAVLDLDGFFGLHPSMSALQPLWNQRHLAIVHAAGSPDPTPLALRCAGFHGVGHARREGHRGRLAESRTAFSACARGQVGISRHRAWARRCREFLPAPSRRWR